MLSLTLVSARSTAAAHYEVWLIGNRVNAVVCLDRREMEGALELHKNGGLKVRVTGLHDGAHGMHAWIHASGGAPRARLLSSHLPHASLESSQPKSQPKPHCPQPGAARARSRTHDAQALTRSREAAHSEAAHSLHSVARAYPTTQTDHCHNYELSEQRTKRRLPHSAVEEVACKQTGLFSGWRCIP